MENVDNLLQFYSSGLYHDFCKLAEPLNESFHLDSFFYSLTTPEGYFFQISNQVEVSRFYFSNNLFQYNPFICHPDNYRHNQIVITGGFPNRQFQKAQKLIKNKYGLENFLTVYKKESGFAHVLMFSSTQPDIPLNTTFVSNLASFQKFGDYFIQEWRKNLLRMQGYMINLGKLMGPKYFEINPLFRTQDQERLKKLQFLRRIGQINDHFITPAEFSPKELICINYFLRGKSAREIGEITGLSRRTVEHYLENIKSKVGCFTKSELFHRLEQYQHLELL